MDERTLLETRPWLRSPFELIRHAHGHFRSSGDTDRLIALIGFDNAIEVCIDVFLNLHPRVRGGVLITREEIEKATRNYHTKVEFLYEYAGTRGISVEVSIEAILWYHQMRNTLYHSGNGMIPEQNVVKGAWAAANAVFRALFGVDISKLLEGPTTRPKRADIMGPLAEADSIRKSLKANGPVSVWQLHYEEDDFVFIVRLPDKRYGMQLAKWIDSEKRWVEKTSFVKGDGNWEELVSYLERFATQYTGFLPT